MTRFKFQLVINANCWGITPVLQSHFPSHFPAKKVVAAGSFGWGINVRLIELIKPTHKHKTVTSNCCWWCCGCCCRLRCADKAVGPYPKTQTRTQSQSQSQTPSTWCGL